MGKVVFGQIGRLKQEKIAEYKKLHMEDVYSEQWAGVLSMISQCHMQNYSIFIKDDLVFGYFEYTGTDYEADMAKMNGDPVTNAWWKLTRPCFTMYDENSKEAFYEDMCQIFQYEG